MTLSIKPMFTKCLAKFLYCVAIFAPLYSVQRLVVKPDQLIKRRGKLGLIGVNLNLEGVKEWLKPRMMRETTVSSRLCRHHMVVHHMPSLTINEMIYLGFNCSFKAYEKCCRHVIAVKCQSF